MDFYDRKTFLQPVVGLLDVELALNENRTWDNSFSKDFKDLVQGKNLNYTYDKVDSPPT